MHIQIWSLLCVYECYEYDDEDEECEKQMDAKEDDGLHMDADSEFGHFCVSINAVNMMMRMSGCKMQIHAKEDDGLHMDVDSEFDHFCCEYDEEDN